MSIRPVPNVDLGAWLGAPDDERTAEAIGNCDKRRIGKKTAAIVQ